MDEREKIREAFQHKGLKKSGVAMYTSSLYRFLKRSNLSLEDLDTWEIRDLEDRVKETILGNVGVLAPKTLNVMLNAVKTYLYFMGRIRSRKSFIEIRFDKSSTLENGLLCNMLETQDLRKMFKLANGKKRIVLGLLGLAGLRPSLIPYLKVKHIHKDFIKLKDGKVKLKRPTLLIIPHVLTDKLGRPLRDDLGRVLKVTGNKANIPFPCFIPSAIAEVLETELNKDKVTLETRLTSCDNKRQVNFLIKSLYNEINYSGKMRDLRNFASTLLDRLTLIYNDKDLKEFMLGHKPKVGNGLYTLKGLTSQKLAEWTEKYTNSVENWVNEQIFGISRKNNFEGVLLEILRDMGTSKRDLGDLERDLEQGKLEQEAFKVKIKGLINDAYERRIKEKFDSWFQEKVKEIKSSL